MARAGLLWMLLAIPSLSGCAMCCGVDDENYAAYGGVYERADMRNGRVGSAFAPAEAGRATVRSLDSVLETESELEPVPAPEGEPGDDTPPEAADSEADVTDAIEAFDAQLQPIDQFAAPVPDFDL